MKKNDMLAIIRAVLVNELNYDYITGLELMVLEAIEEAGMLPPVQNPSLVEDTYHGGQKHGPAQHIWNKE